jgi:hypothetical protein
MKNYGISKLPEFLILGAAKSGTTSFYHSLTNHPDIGKATSKELDFFSNEYIYRLGMNWYKDQFKHGTGEATPYYLFYPLARERICKHLPNAKFIVLLRNPVDRAYSHYRFSKRTRFENRTFRDALEQGSINDFRNHSYVERSQYVDQIEEWFKLVPKDRFLIIKAEDYFDHPGSELSKAVKFLGHEEYKLSADPKHRFRGTYPDMDRDDRYMLEGYFKPYNDRLNKLIGITW